MPSPVLFIQGAGAGAYAEDAVLVERLQRALGGAFAVTYPAMFDEGEAPYDIWTAHIEQALADLVGPVILVGHSVGGSVLAKYVVQSADWSRLMGLFLLAAPFWGGDGWRYDGFEELELPPATAVTPDPEVPIFLFHCRDDETVPVDHLTLYQRRLPQAVGRVLDEGGHQFDADLTPIVAQLTCLTMP